MKKQFVVFEKSSFGIHYIVDDLNSLISGIYEYELNRGESFEIVKEWFFELYSIFESNVEIKEVSN